MLERLVRSKFIRTTALIAALSTSYAKMSEAIDIQLMWTKPYGTLEGYPVYEKKGDSQWKLASYVLESSCPNSATLCSTILLNREPGFVYSYKVRAKATSGAISGDSNKRSIALGFVSPGDVNPPVINVNGVNNFPIYTTQQTLELTGNASDESSYIVKINGDRVSYEGLNIGEINWSRTLELNERRNPLVITAKDDAGNISVPINLEATLDSFPPEGHLNVYRQGNNTYLRLDYSDVTPIKVKIRVNNSYSRTFFDLPSSENGVLNFEIPREHLKGSNIFRATLEDKVNNTHEIIENYEIPSPTPISSPTPTLTATPTPTHTLTPTLTPTLMPTYSFTPTLSHISTSTPTQSPTSTPTATTIPELICYGDCDFSGKVEINEVITSVNIALGNEDIEVCLPADVNQDEKITVNELLVFVNNSLRDCE